MNDIARLDVTAERLERLMEANGYEARYGMNRFAAVFLEYCDRIEILDVKIVERKNAA